MLRMVARLRARTRAMPARSPFTSVIPALWIATSVPVPIANPTRTSRRRRPLSAGMSRRGPASAIRSQQRGGRFGEAAEDDIMQRPPRTAASPLFSPAQGAIAFIPLAALYVLALERSLPETDARSLTARSRLRRWMERNWPSIASSRCDMLICGLFARSAASNARTSADSLCPAFGPR